MENSTNVQNQSAATSADEGLCQVARTILDTPGFSALLITEIASGVAATLLNALLLVVVWRVSVFHRNLRLLLLHLSLSLLWYSAAYVVKAGSLLPRTFGAGDPCDMKMRMFDCRVFEIPNAVPVQTAVYTQLAISLERLYSTVRYKRYSDTEGRRWANRPVLAIILIPLCYAVPVFNIVNSLIRMPPSEMVAICENLLSMTPGGATTSLANNFAALLASTLCVFAVWYWNGYKLRAMMANKAKHTLSSRFQIDQNIQINRVIVPDMVLLLCCYIPNYVFMFLVVLNLPLNYEVKAILIHVNYLWKIAYAVAHPAVVLERNAHVRKRVKEMAPLFLRRLFRFEQETHRVFAIVDKERRLETRTHFQMLEDAWNKPVK